MGKSNWPDFCLKLKNAGVRLSVNQALFYHLTESFEDIKFNNLITQ